MSKRVILLTIKQLYANRILNGDQVVEHRRRPPKISKPTRTILYVSVLQQILGECVLAPAYREPTPFGFPMSVTNPVRYTHPISWSHVRREIPDIRSPQQSFRYLNPTNKADSRLLEILKSYY
jgi:predicted transcriptional regulator